MSGTKRLFRLKIKLGFRRIYTAKSNSSEGVSGIFLSRKVYSESKWERI